MSLETALHLYYIAAHVRSSSCIQSSNKASSTLNKPILDNVMISRGISDSLNKQVTEAMQLYLHNHSLS